MALIACNGCGRHVRDAECPFCGAENTIPQVPEARSQVTGLTRAALVLGATVAVSACSSTATTDDAGMDSGPEVVDASMGVDAAYGGPPLEDGGPGDAATAQDAGQDAGAIAAYGGPPVDAGPDASATLPAYGAIPVDSGV